mgnify:CR=1 FL=1
MTLPKLTRTGIADVLRVMGNPLDELITKEDVLAELERLSEGDPLLVRLYVEAFQRIEDEVGRLLPEALAGLEPGLKGYLTVKHI